MGEVLRELRMKGRAAKPSPTVAGRGWGEGFVCSKGEEEEERERATF